MQPLLSSREMREVDKLAIKDYRIPELVLMEHAGLAVVDRLKQRFGSLLPKCKGVILAGYGNNGGDALAAARILHQLGGSSLLVAVLGEKPFSLENLSESARIQLQILGRLGIASVENVDPAVFKSCDFIVDGLLGTGMGRPVGPALQEVITEVNKVSAEKWTVAIDLPSGLDADTGRPNPIAVSASETVSLGFCKKGLVTGRASEHVGQLRLYPIQIPREIPFPIDTFWYDRSDAERLPNRRKASHKGDFGHVYIWMGEADKEGAGIIAGFGALRSGSGLVTALTTSPEILRPRLPPEVMIATADEKFFSKGKGSLVLGPGLDPKNSQAIIRAALLSPLNLVLDAGALYQMAAMGSEAVTLLKKRKSAHTVLTPHPKEAAALLGITIDEIENDRYASVQKLAEKYHSHVLLKGKGTLVRGPQGPTLAVTQGDSGLSKGGSGDLLSGILASLLAQNLPLDQVGPLGAYLQGRASELLTQKMGTTRSSIPSEIAAELPNVFSELER